MSRSFAQCHACKIHLCHCSLKMSLIFIAIHCGNIPLFIHPSFVDEHMGNMNEPCCACPLVLMCTHFYLRIYIGVHIRGHTTRICLALMDIDKQFFKTLEPNYTHMRVRVVSCPHDTWYTVFLILVTLGVYVVVILCSFILRVPDDS